MILSTDHGERAASIVQRIIFERVGIKIPVKKPGAADNEQNCIVLVMEDELDSELSQLNICFPGVRRGLGEDGYRMGAATNGDNRYFIVSGANRRGIVHGAGAMLRAFRWYKDRIEAPWVCLASSPVHELRASLTSTHNQDQGYKWWSAEQWAAYLEDLQLWGANTAMYIPLQFGQRNEQIWTEGTEYANIYEPMLKFPEIAQAMDMKVGAYMGLNDVYPTDAKKHRAAVNSNSVYNIIMTEQSTICPSAEGAEECILKRREELFSKLSRLDYLYVPTTDYGGCGCEECKPYLTKIYLPLYKKIADLLRKYHPEAKIIMSNQYVNEAGMREILLPLFASEEGKWADIMCLGAGSTSANLGDMLDLLPAERQKIVVYPEMTMTDGWGVFGFMPFVKNFNFLLGYGFYQQERPFGFPPELEFEASWWNPRKVPGFDFGSMGSAVVGSYAYSEGLHDDLTKIAWLSNNWTPGIDSDQVALAYCRYYFGEEAAYHAYRLCKLLEERSVLRCYALLKKTDYNRGFGRMLQEIAFGRPENEIRRFDTINNVPPNACHGNGIEEIVNNIDMEASLSEGLMPRWAKDGWRWKLIRFRVVIERIGLAIECEDSGPEMGLLKEAAIRLSRELYEEACITTLSRMVKEYDLASDYKPEWSEDMNRNALEAIIERGRNYKRLKAEYDAKQV